MKSEVIPPTSSGNSIDDSAIFQNTFHMRDLSVYQDLRTSRAHAPEWNDKTLL